MDAFFLVLSVLLGFGMIYIIMKNQIAAAMDEKLHFLYKERIEADIQNIYREFESYSAIIDSRINRLKNLTERQEASLKTWENIQNEIRKTKTGKEVLKYIESQNDKSLLTRDDIDALKKEITNDLKTYLSLKLKLEEKKTSAPPKEAALPVIPSGPAKTPKPEKPASQPTPRATINTRTSQEKTTVPDDEFNVAELIVDDLVKNQQKSQLARTPIAETSGATGGVKNLYSAPAPEMPAPRATPENKTESKFIDTLASIGKSLMPLFFKQTSPTAPEINTRAKQANFGEMIRKDSRIQAAATTPNQTRLTGQESRQEPQSGRRGPSSEVSSETITLKSSISPDEMSALVASLRNPRSRPEALRSLLGRGYDLNQIAELSNVPFSDLELTRNLYRI